MLIQVLPFPGKIGALPRCAMRLFLSREGYTCADYLSWSDDERWEFGIGAGVLLAALVLAHG